MIEFDPIDRKILQRMQHDADCSLEQLGGAVGLSRNACWRRLKMLQERGVIAKKVALLDPKSLDLGQMVFIQIRTDRHDEDWLEEFARVTRDMPEILGVYRMTGDLDYLVKVRVADVRAYDRLYKDLVRRVPILDVSASFVMEEIKETTCLPIP